MTHAPEEPRTRRSSDASVYSDISQFSWKHMIQPEHRYRENGLATYLGDVDETASRLMSLNIRSDEIPPIDPQGGLLKQRGRYLSSPVPGLATSEISSMTGSSITSMLPNQMYSLDQDSSGALYTRIQGGPVVVNTSPPKDGDYQCLFAFSGCQAQCTIETWAEHVETHLSSVEPPKSCLCPICGELFETGTPAVTWSRFLDHFPKHKYYGRIHPDAEFLEFCRENNLISDFTRERLEQNPQTQRMSQEPNQYRNMTPRRFADGSRGDSSIARVTYPNSWEKTTPEQRPNRQDILISRNHHRHGRYRA